MLVAQNSLGPVCPVPLTVRGKAEGQARTERFGDSRAGRVAPARATMYLVEAKLKPDLLAFLVCFFLMRQVA